jgi:hypothetical protein
MAEDIDQHRRSLLKQAAMTMAAAQFGLIGTVQAKESREFAALGRATEWLNSPRLTPEMLLGKVVVINFCTYTCINWLRTLPYVRAWAQKYAPGLVMIGVHTPEFPFEQNIENVRRSVRQLKIDYPIVIDNDYAIWRAFRNQYWPALYFIDASGKNRQNHFGEGEYERSEKAIQRLLADAKVTGVRTDIVSVEAGGIEAPADWENLRTPETYVGYERTQNFASRGGADPDRRRTYAVPSRLALNEWALAGEWTVGRQIVVLSNSNGRIAYRFHARDLHLVMGPQRRESPVRFRVSIDGQPPGPARGGDVDADGNGTVAEQRLYQLIRQSRPIADRTFAIEFLDPGAEVFAFTFG